MGPAQRSRAAPAQRPSSRATFVMAATPTMQYTMFLVMRDIRGKSLPKSFNASYGDLPYAEKREHYLGQNLLARSLHEQAYDHNPGFRQFIDRSGVSFRAHPEFRKADLDARQQLYRSLAEQIWSP